MTFFTDSKVVLGYICNHTRRFFQYVSNRVERILKVSSSSQWRYISTVKNPADYATRCSTAYSNLNDSVWLQGPRKLETVYTEEQEDILCPMVDSNNGKEVKSNVTVYKTSIKTALTLGCERFKNFSRWNVLVRAIIFQKGVARLYKSRLDTNELETKTVADIVVAEIVILKEVQKECFPEEISRLVNKRNLQKESKIITLLPFMDDNGLLRVGGRLSRIRSQVPVKEVNPVILPKNHYISLLLIQHYNESVKHQGRLITEGVLRSAGFWVIGAKRMISPLIHNCVTCRRLRRGTEQQKMADLPEDRITHGPPFTSVGVDAFGPWQVLTRKTRGEAANSKRWAILFTCLTTRAVHIEVVEEITSSSFINALRRFLSIRSPVNLFRSDRGTNFIGATDDLQIDAIKVEDGPVHHFLYKSGVKWIFNVPHSSHMGGMWERMIGLTRKVLDSILHESRHQLLTHETLTIFLAEVTAILNNRPIALISMNPTSPLILRPSMLLTGKDDILPAITDSLQETDAHRTQWKRVQLLADAFWHIWRRDVLHCLQIRRKWQVDHPNLKLGDVVLLKEAAAHRNNWPLGIINKTMNSDDNTVRKVEGRVVKDGKTVSYVRPVNEVVLLIA